MQLLDALTHLDAQTLDDTRSTLVSRARTAGVTSWVIAGTRASGWDRTCAVASATGGVAVLGIHPWWAVELDEPAMQRDLADLAARDLLGIGEIGLDGVRAPDDRARRRQRRAFRAQLALARQRDVPVVLHCVRAMPELLTVLERDGLPRAGGMVHGWGGPPELVPRAIALGLSLSFGPQVGRDRAKKVRASVARVPLDHLLLETDCPDQAAGPAHLIDVLGEVAALRADAPSAIAAASCRALRRLLPVP